MKVSYVGTRISLGAFINVSVRTINTNIKEKYRHNGSRTRNQFFYQHQRACSCEPETAVGSHCKDDPRMTNRHNHFARC
ncbi:conserved hypothetical protein, partial [Trichinella spiralis]|uniref:hypothetical protein n=1 Tax=Trichinella spiralis TaxID=6334 RepID=UPI0001EFE50C